MFRQIDPWDSLDHARRPAVEWSGCGKRGRNTPTGNFSWETHSARQTRPVLRRLPAPSHDCDAQSTTALEPGKRARRGRRESSSIQANARLGPRNPDADGPNRERTGTDHHSGGKGTWSQRHLADVG